MSLEKKMMRFVTGGALIGSLVGYFLGLPYVTVCALVCFSISGIGIMLMEKE